MQNQANIETIIRGCQNGDRTAQEKLYSMYYGEMMAICMRYLTNKEVAGEVMNDGFMKIFKALRKGNECTALKSWMRRIMINTAIDHYRANKKHYYGLDVEHIDMPQNDHSVIEHLSAQAILELVQELPDSYRMVFNLHVIDGYTHPQVGELLGISDGTSRSNYSKARIKLQKMIRSRYKMLYKRYAG